jgi:hypothetical protein
VLSCRTLSGYKSTNDPWGAWVGQASTGPLGACCGHESAGPLKDMIYLSSIGTLTPFKMIETFVESVFATVSEWSAIAGHFFVLVRMVRSCVHVIKLPNPISKLTILKIIIPVDSEIKSKIQSHRRGSFWWSANTPHECCLWMVVTIAMVGKIVWLTRRWKSKQVAYGIRNQASPRFTHLRPQT